MWVVDARGKLATGYAPSSESLPTASSNLRTDVNASPFLSANTTCFLGIRGPGGRAKQERKDGCDRSSPGPACGSCCRAGLWLRQRRIGQCPDDVLAALGPLTKGEGSSDEGQKDQAFPTAACGSLRSSPAHRGLKTLDKKQHRRPARVAPWLSVEG